MPTPDQYLAALQDRQPSNRQPKSPFGPRPKRHIGRKLLAIGLLVVGLLGIYALINLLRLSSNPFDFFSALKGESEGRINILVLGVGDLGHAGQNLSDTNMIVSINTKTKQVAMIGIPRDLRVRIPGYGYGKINLAHANGGIDLARRVAEDTFGVPIHYYARANFTGLKEAVDAVGGIDINVKDKLVDPEYPCEKNESRSCGLKILPGLQHMDGATALKYARCRKGTCGDDFGRAMRQQEVLLGVRQRGLSAATLLNPLRLNQLSGALGDNVKTDLSINGGLRLWKMLKDTNKSQIMSIVFSTKPGEFLVSSSSSDLLPKGGDFGAIQQFVQNIFTVGPIWSENAEVIIQNGSGTAGVGGKLRDRVVQDGQRINITAVGNADRSDYTVSQVIDYSGGNNPNTIKYFEELLKVKALAPAVTVKNPPADIKVIVGSDYLGIRS